MYNLNSGSSVVGVEDVNDSAHKLAELVEEWRNRLTLQAAPFVEHYLQGRPTIFIYLNWSFEANQAHVAGTFFADIHGPHRQAISLHAKQLHRRHLYEWNDKTVLVDDVQIVHCNKKIIPSFVRFYDLQDNLTKHGVGLIY